MAMSIEDILARRIGLQFYGWREAIQTAPVVAGLLALELGWSNSVERQALDQYVGKIQGYMRKAGLSNSAPRAS
jgi:glycerol-3-phosphate dehydrogenase